MMDHRKRFVVEPGAKVWLGKTDAAFKDEHESQDTSTPEIQKWSLAGSSSARS
ncbi:MAG: hypothetical protein WAN81_04065 [Candidatus Binataceae bacterium]